MTTSFGDEKEPSEFSRAKPCLESVSMSCAFEEVACVGDIRGGVLPACQSWSRTSCSDRLGCTSWSLHDILTCNSNKLVPEIQVSL
jgi:hypothetical protein